MKTKKDYLENKKLLKEFTDDIKKLQGKSILKDSKRGKVLQNDIVQMKRITEIVYCEPILIIDANLLKTLTPNKSMHRNWHKDANPVIFTLCLKRY